MALIKCGGWGFVTDTEDEPDFDDDHAAWRKFLDRKNKALATIVLAIDPALLYLLGDPQDPAEVWQKLADQYEKKSWANKLALRRKLYSLRLKENECVQKHIKSMIEIFDSLSVVGHVIEEEDRVVHILASLPESYQMLVTALEANPEVPQLEVVTERILHEEKKLKEKSGQRRPPEDALLVRSRSGGPVCFYCGQTGHIKKFCEEWKKKNEEEEKKGVDKKQNEEASYFCKRGKTGKVGKFVQDSDSDSDIDCIALVSQVSTVEHTKQWIIDSAASMHMCNNPRAMKNLKKLDITQRIKVGNGQYLEAKAEGTVKLEVNAGNSIRKFKLGNVLLAPELKFNLFSVSKAAESGKTVEFGKQGCRIIENSTRQTIGSGRKRGNLYHLNCVRKDGGNNKKRENLDCKQMERALKIVSENNFEKEMMIRLDRVERKIKQSYTIKEDNDQSQEDSNNSKYEKSQERFGCWTYDEVQEDQVQEDSQIEVSDVVQEILRSSEVAFKKDQVNKDSDQHVAGEVVQEENSVEKKCDEKDNKQRKGSFSKLKKFWRRKSSRS